MTRRTRALVALWGTAGLLAAPWVIDWLVTRGGRHHQTATFPKLPHFRLDTPRRTAC